MSFVARCISAIVVGLAFSSSQAQVPVWSTEPPNIPARYDWIASGLSHPWGLDFLPDGNFLVTLRAGQLMMISPKGIRQQVRGVPPAYAELHGGLLDVALHPDFKWNRLVYLSMSQGTRNANRMTLVRGRLSGNQLVEVRTIFAVSQFKSGPEGFGGRLCWLPDKTLLFSIGDGGNPPTKLNGILIREYAQRLDSHLGKVLRLKDDGTAPSDNPFFNTPGAMKEIWTLGHRHPQGLVYDPVRKVVFQTEHGPQGGDELNVLVRGANYGWPRATWGIDYSGAVISSNRSLQGMRDPIAVWTPCIGVSGVGVYYGPHFPTSRGRVMACGMRGVSLREMGLGADLRTTSQRRFGLGYRIRQMKQGPDGYMYILTDMTDGHLIRISPAP